MHVRTDGRVYVCRYVGMYICMYVFMLGRAGMELNLYGTTGSIGLKMLDSGA